MLSRRKCPRSYYDAGWFLSRLGFPYANFLPHESFSGYFVSFFKPQTRQRLHVIDGVGPRTANTSRLRLRARNAQAAKIVSAERGDRELGPANATLLRKNFVPQMNATKTSANRPLFQPWLSEPSGQSGCCWARLSCNVRIPSSRTPLLGPSPLRTVHASFLAHSSSPANASLRETRLRYEKTLAVNPVVALRMK